MYHTEQCLFVGSVRHVKSLPLKIPLKRLGPSLQSIIQNAVCRIGLSREISTTKNNPFLRGPTGGPVLCPPTASPPLSSCPTRPPPSASLLHCLPCAMTKRQVRWSLGAMRRIIFQNNATILLPTTYLILQNQSFSNYLYDVTSSMKIE